MTTPVSAKILSEAETQAQQILSDAYQQIQQLQEQSQKELDNLDQNIQADVDQAVAQEQHRILADARQTVAAEALQAKHQVLDKVFDAAQAALTNLAPDQYKKLLVDLLKQAVSSGNETVVPAEGEKHLDQKLLDTVNQQLKDTGKLQLATEKTPGVGGFVLTEDKVNTRVTWDILLSQARRELEPELSKLLFAQEPDKPKQ